MHHTKGAMNGTQVLEGRPPTAHLPPELRQRIVSLLAPHDVAFGLRLSCREEGVCYREPVYRTASLSQPVPGHVVDTAWCLGGAQAAMKQLTLYQKLMTLSTAAASGREANVEFAWRLLQPHVFPELLRTEGYWTRLTQWYRLGRLGQWPDLGCAAVASGLAHLLPSLAQRCPALLDPARTLEAAARHCDLAGLQAAWGALGPQLQSSIRKNLPAAWDTWYRVMRAAATSEAPDVTAKMGWVVGMAKRHRVGLAASHSDVYGGAAASGDLSRLAWLRDSDFPLCTVEMLEAVVRDADLVFIHRLEQEGGYLPPAEEAETWTSERVVAAAAASTRDSATKLRWLAGRGAALGSRKALRAAARSGNLEAVQLLAGQGGQEPAGREGEAGAVLDAAVRSGSIPVAAWLRQAGYPWGYGCFDAAFRRGDLPMVRWLLEASCPRGRYSIEDAVGTWPADTPADSGRLVDVLRLLAAAGWRAWPGCLAAAAERQPDQVLVALRELLAPAAQPDFRSSGFLAAASGCEATLEALVGMSELQDEHGAGLEAAKRRYVDAAANGDRASLECLVRLGVPLGEGVLAAAIQQQAPVPALQWLVEQGAPRGGAEEALVGAPPQRREEVEALLRGLPEP